MVGLFGKRKSSPGRPQAAMINADPNYPGELDRFKPGEVESLVHLLDDEFFAFCYEHRESSACLGEDCPLCRDGDKPEFYVLINVVVIAQSQGPRFSAWDIQTDKLKAPLRRPVLKLWFATPHYASAMQRGLEKWKPPRKMNDPDVYFWVTKNSAHPMTADKLAEEWRTRPLTWIEQHEYSLAKWTSEWVETTPGAGRRMSPRKPDRRT